MTGHVTLLKPFWATNFVIMLTGAMELVVGPSFAVLAVVYTLAAFWGQYLVFTAFRSALPRANHRLAAVLIFLLPSMAYWTAMIGKDALLSLGTGLVTYGLVRMSSRLELLGIIPFASGIAICFAARPHIAAIAALAGGIALIVGRNVSGVIGAATRLLSMPLVLGLTIFVGMNASSEWRINDLQSGIVRQESAMQDSSYGGSAFSQSKSLAIRLALAPALIFRPMPWEVRSWQAGLASIEGVGILVLFWRRRKSLALILKDIRRSPLIVYCVLFLFMFIFGVAPGIGNFGLLVRQRVMILPYALLLLCVPSQAEADYSRERTRTGLMWHNT